VLGSADDPNALLAAGRAKLAAGETLNALLLLRRACAGLPDNAEAFFLLGAAHHRANQFRAALTAFDRAVALDGSQRQAAIGTLAVLCQLGRAQEAKPRAEALIGRHPGDPQVHYNAALVHEALGEFEDAIARYDTTLDLQPAHREALLNRGSALARLGQFEAAHANNLRLATAYPDWSESHFNVAEVCLALSRYDEALAASDRALALAPEHAAAHRDRGLALAALGRLPEAQAALDRARTLDLPIAAARSTKATSPDDNEAFDARVVHLVRAYGRVEACDWTDLEAYRRRFVDLVECGAGPPLGAAALGFPAMMLGLPPQTQLRLARNTAARYASDMPAIRKIADPSERIRVGYVSSDFGDHPMSHTIAPFLAKHDRTRLEVFGYALSADDGSVHRRAIADACDHFEDVADAATTDIAARVVRERIDVLVNLNGYTAGHRTALFALRPAPVQVSYFGFPGTMGAQFMDYLIADRIVVPERDAQWYTESLAWLPHCYFSADRDEPLLPPPPREAVGLPHQGVVFCDFNQHVKITPDVFAIWMRILTRVPGSVLWLLAGPGEANLRRYAEAAGVDPGRLVFAARLPRPRHLARTRLADLVLDTRPCNAHTTAADALRAGVPVLTCPGETFASRVAASLACAAGLHELVVRDMEAYEALAVALAHDPQRLGSLKRALAAGLQTLPVFDAAGRARELESAYSEMVARQRRELPPAAFSVPAGA